MRKDLEGIELLKEESPGVPELLADPGMIEHAFVNLIQNSIHALSMVEHPRITVRTYSRDSISALKSRTMGVEFQKRTLRIFMNLLLL
jgi:nitrogen-specific signal transduction histidine kinase